MKKNYFYLFGLLVLIIVIILYHEWQIFKQPLPKMVSEEIIVKTEANTLQVTQKIKNLQSKHNYKLVIPSSVHQWLCMNRNGKPCISQKNSQDSIQTQKDEIRIQFSLNLNQTKHSFLLTDWLIKLDKTKIDHMIVEIVDSNFRKGSWVVGLPLHGVKKLKYINYYVFNGVNGNPPLFWQDTPLYLTLSNKYSSGYTQNPNEKISISTPLKEKAIYFAFIHSDKHSPINVPGMIISKDLFTDHKPLFFYDKRVVRINGTLALDFYCLREGNQLFFPFKETMKRFGYSVEENHIQNSISMKKNNRNFVFFPNQNSFLHNDQKYGFLNSPFITQNDEIYISQTGLYTLFNINIESSDKDISIAE